MCINSLTFDCKWLYFCSVFTLVWLKWSVSFISEDVGSFSTLFIVIPYFIWCHIWCRPGEVFAREGRTCLTDSARSRPPCLITAGLHSVVAFKTCPFSSWSPTLSKYMEMKYTVSLSTQQLLLSIPKWVRSVFRFLSIPYRVFQLILTRDTF